MSEGSGVEAPIRIVYRIRFESGATAESELLLDADTLEPIGPPHSEPASGAPAWTALDQHQCSHCPLAPSPGAACPAARALAPLVTRFLESSSTERVHVEVETPERGYVKDASLQAALQSLFGLVMATSGCPHLEFLRANARFHLPFATTEETMVRVVSMHLLRQYLAYRRGGQDSIDAGGLAARYDAVSKVNRGMLARLGAIGARDGGRNALVILDAFGKMTKHEARDEFPMLAKLVR
jgi:hypothetical protein